MKTEALTSCLLCGSTQIHTRDPAARIDQCRTCGYTFDNPRPTAGEIAGFYSRPSKYNSWLAQEDAFDRLSRRRLAKLPAKAGDLLDVGAGIGQFLFHAREQFASVQGTEVSRSAIEIARRKYGINLIQGQVEALNLPPASFDVITLFHVLEHVTNPRTTVEACHRLLRADGVLVIAVPNDLLSLRQKSKGMLGKLGIPRFRRAGRLQLSRVVLDGSVDEIHLSHFTPAVLRHLVVTTGFSNVRISLDPWYPVTGWRLACHRAYQAGCGMIHKAVGVNLYDSIWIEGTRS